MKTFNFKPLLVAFMMFTITLCFMALSMPVHAGEVVLTVPDGLGKILGEANTWVILAVLVWEHLVAKSKVKSNSTIDMVVNLLKTIFKDESNLKTKSK